jgi:hypothetical protein
MPETSTSEADLVDDAVQEALDLVDQGDRAIVAVDYAADKRDLEHRREDIAERVKEAIQDA